MVQLIITLEGRSTNASLFRGFVDVAVVCVQGLEDVHLFHDSV